MSVEKLFENAPAKTVLAPMAGYTDFAFRKICKDYGAGLTVTEMVSSQALIMGSELSRKMLKRLRGDAPAFCQIFGHVPEVMADSVRLEEVRSFDGVDINMGCPVKKIVSNGDGSALMADFKLASKCISAVKLALNGRLLSVKFRLGICDDGLAPDFAKMCADSGADFVTVHFRTRKQMYSGEADFRLLPQIVKCGIPVFANGDVKTRERYLELTELGAYGVSVGRGAVGRPQIFSEIACLPYRLDVYETVKRHIDGLSEVFSDRVVANEIKKHAAMYFKGKRNAKSLIVAVNTAKTTEEILNLIKNFLTEYPQYGMAESHDKYCFGRTRNTSKHGKHSSNGCCNGKQSSPRASVGI